MNVFSRIKLLLELQSALGRFQSAWQKFIKDGNVNTLTVGQTLKSKTFWLNLAAFAVAGYQQVQGTLPPQVTSIVSAAVPIITILWKIFSNKQVPQG